MRWLSESYKVDQLKLMDAFKAGLTPEYSVITACPVTKKWTIGRLLAKEIQYVALNMGAGVMKITTKVATCPKCKGLGCVADKTTLV